MNNILSDKIRPPTPTRLLTGLLRLVGLCFIVACSILGALTLFRLMTFFFFVYNPGYLSFCDARHKVCRAFVSSKLCSIGFLA